MVVAQLPPVTPSVHSGTGLGMPSQFSSRRTSEAFPWSSLLHKKAVPPVDYTMFPRLAPHAMAQRAGQAERYEFAPGSGGLFGGESGCLFAPRSGLADRPIGTVEATPAAPAIVTSVSSSAGQGVPQVGSR